MENNNSNSDPAPTSFSRRLRILFLLVLLSLALAAGFATFTQMQSAPETDLNFASFLRILDEIEQPSDNLKRQAAPIIQSTLGFGRHPFSNALAFQLVQLPNSGQTWTDPKGFTSSLPKGATLDSSPSTQSVQPQTKVWPTIKAYLEGMYDWTQAAVITPSPLAESHRFYDDVQINYFAGASSTNPGPVGQTRLVVPLYRLSLATPDALSALPLQPGVAKAFQRLLNMEYPKYQPYYFALFDRVGTSVVWQSLQGGLVERITYMRPDVWQFGGEVASPDWVREQLSISWYAGQDAAQWSRNEPKFSRNIDWIRQICRGGGAYQINCAKLSGLQLDAWRNELWQQPVAVEDGVVPLWKIAPDQMGLRQRLAQATTDYLNRERPKFQSNP